MRNKTNKVSSRSPRRLRFLVVPWSAVSLSLSLVAVALASPAAAQNTASSPQIDVSVTEVSITSTPGHDNDGGSDTYEKGDVITVGVTFNSDVAIFTLDDLYLTVELSIGDRNVLATLDSTERTRHSDTHSFHYRVEPGLTDDDGISIEENALSFLSGVRGTVLDRQGNAVNLILNHSEVAASTSHKVLSSEAVITSVEIVDQRAEGDRTNNLVTYDVGDVIKFKVTFSESVTVRPSYILGTANPDDPQLNFQIGRQRMSPPTGSPLAADYLSNESDGAVVMFSYTVIFPDAPPGQQAVTVPEGRIDLNDGDIQDSLGFLANEDHAGTVIPRPSDLGPDDPPPVIHIVSVAGGL